MGHWLLRTAYRFVFSREILLSAIIVGVGLRISSAFLISVGFDANHYLVMGESFSRTGEFLVPWGDPGSPGLVPSFSHHMSPLWPMILGATFALFGYSIGLAKAVSFFTSLFVLPVTYTATRDLYGNSTALATTTVIALLPELILDVGRVYSENLTMIFFVLTIWAILKSLRDRRFMLLGGLFAGLVYLSRASAGYFFLVAGLAGLAWRFRYMRFGVFRDRSYLGAIGIFGGIVLAWSLRNVARFGFPHWETDAYLSSYTIQAFANPAGYGQMLLLTVILFIVFLVSLGAFFGPEIVKSLRLIRREEESGLWLGIVLVPLVAAFIAAVFATFEIGGQSVLSIDRIRYVIYAFFPLLLVGLRRIEIRSLLERGPEGDSQKDLRLRLKKPTSLQMAATLICAVSLAFSALAFLLWLIPLLVLGLLAVYVADSKTRLLLLVAALLLVSVEVGTSSTITAEGQSVQFILGLDVRAVVAFEGGSDLYYNLSVYVIQTSLELTDFMNSSRAEFVISSSSGLVISGMSPVATFYDRASQGVVQTTLFSLIGRSTTDLSSPVTVYQRA